MPTTDEAEIRAIIADQLAALHDRDPERMLADYTADVVQYTLAPPLQHRGCQAAQELLDLVHISTPRRSSTGRTSTSVNAASGTRAASSTARSRLAHSTR